MFVVSPLMQKHDPVAGTPPVRVYPVVFEDLDNGYSTPPVAYEETREKAQLRADALNAVLTKEFVQQ